MQLLLERGASVKVLNNKGQSVLSLAAAHLTEETVELLRVTEVAQAETAWCNYRASNSDGLRYVPVGGRTVFTAALQPSCGRWEAN